MLYRRALIVLALALAPLFASASASALTVSPSGAYTFTATGNQIWTLSSTRQVVTCTGAVISATINGSGAGTSTAGTTSWSGCSNALIGAWTITQLSNWSVAVTLTAGLVGYELTIPARGMLFRNSACSYTVNGRILFGHTVAALPAALTTTDVFSTLSSTFTVDSVSNCSPLLTTVGLTATMSFSMRFNRAFTVSG